MRLLAKQHHSQTRRFLPKASDDARQTTPWNQVSGSFCEARFGSGIERKGVRSAGWNFLLRGARVVPPARVPGPFVEWPFGATSYSGGEVRTSRSRHVIPLPWKAARSPKLSSGHILPRLPISGPRALPVSSLRFIEPGVGEAISLAPPRLNDVSRSQPFLAARFCSGRPGFERIS